MTAPIIALAWLIAIGACATLEFQVRASRGGRIDG